MTEGWAGDDYLPERTSPGFLSFSTPMPFDGGTLFIVT
jgi:hypothetical protein